MSFSDWKWKQTFDPCAVSLTPLARLLALLSELPNERAAAELALIDWHAPASHLVRFGEPLHCRSQVEFSSPASILVRLQYRRLIEQVFTEKLLAEPRVYCADGRGNTDFAHPAEEGLCAAFLVGDPATAAQILALPGFDPIRHFSPMCGADRPGPLRSLACGRQTPQAAQELFDLAIEQMLNAGLASIYEEPGPKSKKNKAGKPARPPADPAQELRRRVAARLLPQAAEQGNFECCKMLLDNGAGVSRSAISASLRCWNFALFDLLAQTYASQSAACAELAEKCAADYTRGDPDKSSLGKSLAGLACSDIRSALESRSWKSPGESESYEMLCFKEIKPLLSAWAESVAENGSAYLGEKGLRDFAEVSAPYASVFGNAFQNKLALSLPVPGPAEAAWRVFAPASKISAERLEQARIHWSPAQKKQFENEFLEIYGNIHDKRRNSPVPPPCEPGKSLHKMASCPPLPALFSDPGFFQNFLQTYELQESYSEALAAIELAALDKSSKDAKATPKPKPRV